MASLWKLPVVYVIENNQYALSMPNELVSAVTDLSSRGCGYNIPGETVDGNNVAAVYRAAKRAVDRARDGKGPFLLECITYRLRGHARFEPANYRQKDEVEEMRNKVMVVASTVSDASKMFGVKEELDPVYWMLGAAMGWGGLPAKDAMYAINVPEKNDGKTAYTLTAKDVPVDAFWSVTLYDDKGWMPVNKYKAYSFNNVTAKKDKDGSITIHFGGDPKQANFLPIVPGWNYIVRLYKPKKEILDGSWTFPKPRAVE